MTVAVDRDQALLARVCGIARGISAVRADDVGRHRRLPAESIETLREQGALSASVPAELGGAGVSTATIAACCRELGRACGASAMVFAMHHVQLISLGRHYESDDCLEPRRRRRLGLVAAAPGRSPAGGFLTATNLAMRCEIVHEGT